MRSPSESVFRRGRTNREMIAWNARCVRRGTGPGRKPSGKLRAGKRRRRAHTRTKKNVFDFLIVWRIFTSMITINRCLSKGTAKKADTPRLRHSGLLSFGDEPCKKALAGKGAPEERGGPLSSRSVTSL